mgnify:CR=1 FL=1
MPQPLEFHNWPLAIGTSSTLYPTLLFPVPSANEVHQSPGSFGPLFPEGSSPTLTRPPFSPSASTVPLSTFPVVGRILSELLVITVEFVKVL